VKGQGVIMVLAACALAVACSRTERSHGSAARAQPSPSAYLPPPDLMKATRQAGGVLLSGTATPGAALRLASPDGSAITGAANPRGGWAILAPAGAAPRLYSLSQTIGGRLVRAVGYIAVLPAPGPAAALLRPASSAALPSSDPERGLTAIDYDASGAAMASGRAAPEENVRVFLDGKEAGEDRADDRGVFSATLSSSLAPGPHVLALAGERLRETAAFAAARTAQVATPPFDAARMDGAWRIDWMTPGGGVQSTVLFDPKGGRS
jgi:hypothetical protein